MEDSVGTQRPRGSKGFGWPARGEMRLCPCSGMPPPLHPSGERKHPARPPPAASPLQQRMPGCGVPRALAQRCPACLPGGVIALLYRMTLISTVRPSVVQTRSAVTTGYPNRIPRLDRQGTIPRAAPVPRASLRYRRLREETVCWPHRALRRRHTSRQPRRRPQATFARPRPS